MNNSSGKSQRVLITGAAGQDGTLLRQYLDSIKIPYVGISRPTDNNRLISESSFKNIQSSVWPLSLNNIENVRILVQEFKPTHIFHLATLNGSSRSTDENLWNERLEELRNVQVLIFENIINVVSSLGLKVNIVVAGSSRMYDPMRYSKESVNEQSEPNPIDAYGRAKAACLEISKLARLNGMHVGTAILFNHESTLRKKGYLFSDLSAQIAQFLLGESKFVTVENANATRDWHCAQDTVKGIWIQSNLEKPSDLVLCSGKIRSVVDLIEELFDTYFYSASRPSIVSLNDSIARDTVIGDNSYAKSLGWKTENSVIKVLYDLVIDQLTNEQQRRV